MGHVRAHYEAGAEATRLLSGFGVLEFARTQELLLRHLPPAPAQILDVGGASGIYSAWLGSLGYRVQLLDLVHKHAAAALANGVAAAQADARRLPLPEACCDAVLLMGPLYHLTERDCRMAALAEARRVLRPGGLLCAAAICRFAGLLAALALGLLDDPCFDAILRRHLENGQHRNPTGALEYFTTAFFHLPAELAEETQAAGFTLEALLAIEGPCWLAKDFDATWAREEHRERLLILARQVESDPALLGVSPHLMALGRRG